MYWQSQEEEAVGEDLWPRLVGEAVAAVRRLLWWEVEVVEAVRHWWGVMAGGEARTRMTAEEGWAWRLSVGVVEVLVRCLLEQMVEASVLRLHEREAAAGLDHVKVEVAVPGLRRLCWGEQEGLGRDWAGAVVQTTVVGP